MTEFDEFAKWCADTEFTIQQWPYRLKKEAFKQAYKSRLTNGQTKKLVKALEHDLPREYHATATEIFHNGVTRQIVEEAYKQVNDKINNTPVAEEKDDG